MSRLWYVTQHYAALYSHGGGHLARYFFYRVLGRKITYRLIARGEYDAASAYEHLIPAFPEVESIRADEQRHGDTVKALLTHKESGKKRVLRAILLAAGGLALAGCAYFALSHRRYCRK